MFYSVFIYVKAICQSLLRTLEWMWSGTRWKPTNRSSCKSDLWVWP